MDSSSNKSNVELIDDCESILETVKRINKIGCQEVGKVGSELVPLSAQPKMENPKSPEKSPIDGSSVRVFEIFVFLFSLIVGYILEKSALLIRCLNCLIVANIHRVYEDMENAAQDADDFKWKDFRSYPMILVKKPHPRSFCFYLLLAVLVLGYLITFALLMINKALLCKIPVNFK